MKPVSARRGNKIDRHYRMGDAVTKDGVTHYEVRRKLIFDEYEFTDRCGNDITDVVASFKCNEYIDETGKGHDDQAK